MTIEDLGNIFSLVCTVIGLLYCLFKYIELPKRGYLYLVIFFLAHFLSDFYWTIYTLIMHSYPEVSEFTAYVGWNVAFVFLFLVVLHFSKAPKKYFHLLMLWPLATSIPLFILYIQFGGVLNNLWQVSFTTLSMIFCTRDLLYYRKLQRADRGSLPRVSLFILLLMIVQYVMWTASCFSWPGDLLNPYFYGTLLYSLIPILVVRSAGKDYEASGEKAPQKKEGEMRLQALIQALAAFVILGGCVGGYLIASLMRDTLSSASDIVLVLFLVSAVLILLVIFMMYGITVRYRNVKKKHRETDAGKISRVNLIITVFITFILMAFAVVYNTRLLYDASVTGVYEDGKTEVKTYATDLENYLTVAKTTLRVCADSVALMKENHASNEEILRYITDQTNIQFNQFDQNFTGIYAVVDGEYMDGSGWVPPEDYDPMSRDWYGIVVEGGGDVVIVPPYVDAQTNSVVLTLGKCISEPGTLSSDEPKNVVCLDMIVDHVRDITQSIEIAGRGYGLVVNEDGFIVAHPEDAMIGSNLADSFDSALIDRIREVRNGNFKYEVESEKNTLFVSPILDQWYALIVVSDSELFEEMNSQLAVNIILSLVTFLLITFFYYLGYKNERNYGRQVEAMNLHVVSALAAAIDAKDTYTNGHSARVAEYSRMIAQRLGYSESKQDEIYMMGLLHDVGKIGVPDEVINKPGRLTDEEFALIKKHPVIGSGILESIEERPYLSTGARWHHERYGGGGYPDGIHGEEIPEEVRIIAVADAYDAMTSSRSYRAVMPQEKVRAEIEKGMGTQFDPQFAKVMLQMIDEDKDYRLCGK
ncbi:MAG: HD domain-containing protein [Lachnospiraceae bacterium]|nr:HD domain-containing protein [Lachnospiraceae bacterium]